jgi:hypothetical protein
MSIKCNLLYRGKIRYIPVHNMQAYVLHSFLASALMARAVNFYYPAALSLEKRDWIGHCVV